MESTGAVDRLKAWARAIKRDVVVLWLAARDPRVPWLAKLIAGIVAAYALSPIDLIRDFIPVVGYLDDVIIVPLGIALVVRLIPEAVLADLRAQSAVLQRPTSLAGLLVTIATWVAVIGLALWLWWPTFAGN